MAIRNLKLELETLITANHILHYQNVVDAYGHISFRHPDKPDIFVMSGDKAPALVSSSTDLIEYWVKDSSQVDPKAPRGYQERFIHSEIYKKFPYVNSVIHSHSHAVLPYTMSGVQMQPTFHIAAFLGKHVPNYDITKLYKPGDTQDMLVNSIPLGSVLASAFLAPTSADIDHSVVLMANHGFTAIGTSIKEAVYRAIYTHVNAGIQTSALMLRNAQLSVNPGTVGDIRYLISDEQTAGCMKMNEKTVERPWGLWEREVQVSPLYVRKYSS